MKVLDRIETLYYLNNKISKNERLVVPRYNDGEYLLMNNLKKFVASTNVELISNLLKKSIKIKNQFVCVNYLKPHNISNKDIWYKTQKYLIEESGNNELYGCSNYNTYDFSTDSSILIKQFSGKVLLITGLFKESENFFKDIQPNLKCFETPKENAVLKYEDIKNNILKIINSYDTILFSCGPLSKVLIPDLVDKCKCNLIDLGSVLNAILNLTDQWTMSWIKTIDLEKQIKIFKNGLINNK